MRIGIDITALPPQPTGAGIYTIELVRALLALNTPHKWVIFAQPNGKEQLGLFEDPAVHWVIVSEKPPAQRLLWEQTIFPFLVKKTGLDILHSLHYTRPFFLTCASVVTFHDMTFFLFPELHTRSKRIFFPAAIRMSARLADALIAVSENTRRDAIRLLKVPENKIHSTPNGISDAYQPVSDPNRRYQCQKKHNLPDDFLLFVGTIEPRKNLPVLLKAYRLLIDRVSTSPALPDQQHMIPSLVIVGKMGWMVEDVSQLIDQLELKEKVLLTGYIPTEDMPIVYNSAKVFVYPSIYEGFGLPPLEAMACGTPVITTHSSAMSDYVGEAGILVPPDNASALADALLSLLQNESMQKELSEKGRLQAADFTWKRTAELTLKVYESVVNQSLLKP